MRILLLILLLLSLSSCSVNEVKIINQISADYSPGSSFEIGNSESIIVSHDSIKTKLGGIAGVYNGSIIFYDGDDFGKVKTYCIESQKTSYLFEDSILIDNELMYNHVVTKDWYIWCASTDNTPQGKNWVLRSRKIGTDDTYEIDRDKKVSLPATQFTPYIAPAILSVWDDYLVYLSHDNSNDNVIQRLNVYNLDTKTNKAIFLLDDLENSWMFCHGIDEGKIAWSVSTLDDEWREFGKLYVYNLFEGSITEVLTDKNMLQPIINGNHILACHKIDGLNEGSSIAVYDITENKWVKEISPSAYGSAYDNLYDIRSKGDYALWHDSFSTQVYAYKFSEDMFYLLNNPASSPFSTMLYMDERYVVIEKNSGYSIEYDIITLIN